MSVVVNWWLYLKIRAVFLRQTLLDLVKLSFSLDHVLVQLIELLTIFRRERRLFLRSRNDGEDCMMRDFVQTFAVTDQFIRLRDREVHRLFI